MNNIVSTSLKRRIKNLEYQSLLIVILIFGLICYGLYVSSKASATTESDIGKVSSIAESANLTASVSASKMDLMEALWQLDDRFEDLNNLFSSQIIAFLRNNGAQNLHSYEVDSAFFDTSYSYNAGDRKNVNELIVDFTYGAKCKELFAFGTAKDKKDYLLIKSSGEVLEFNENIANQSYFILEPFRNKAELIKETSSSIIDDLKRKATELTDELCDSFSSSASLVAVKKTYEKIDENEKNIKNLKDLTVGKPSQLGDASSAFYLLVINRFGPLIIVFFFASLLITVYKYNSRLVGYYHARLLAMHTFENNKFVEELTVDSYRDLVDVYSPDQIEYGRTPKTPLNLANDIASKVSEKINSAS